VRAEVAQMASEKLGQVGWTSMYQTGLHFVCTVTLFMNILTRHIIVCLAQLC